MSTTEELLERFSSFCKERRMIEAFKDNAPVSQSKMAKRIGIPQGSLSQYENGTRLPDPANMHKIAAYWGPKVYEILEKPLAWPDDKLLVSIALAWPDVPMDLRKKLVRMAQDASDEFQERKKGIAGELKVSQS